MAPVVKSHVYLLSEVCQTWLDIRRSEATLLNWNLFYKAKQYTICITPSLFGRTSKNLVKELGDKDFRPIQNPLSANKFCQLKLLRKKRRTLSQFWERPDVPVDCTLTDILEPSPSVPVPVVTEKFVFIDKMVWKGAAEVDVTAGLEVCVSGKANQSYECSLEVQSVTISPCNWEDLQKRKVLDQEPSFLKECRTRGDNLYVVTEAVKLINRTVLQDSSRVNVTGQFSVPWSFYAKSTGDRSGLKVRERTLTLPQGTVMAYKRKQLVFRENGRAILLISDDDKRKTFPEDDKKLQELRMSLEILSISEDGKQKAFSEDDEFLKKWPMQSAMGTIRRLILPIGRIQEPICRDFKSLQNEVSREMEAVAELPRDIRDALFHTILAKLKEQGALQDLTDMLDGNLWIHTGSFLSEMQEDSRNVWLESKHIIYLLEALLVLSDIQHELLAWSMEKRILPQQRELVKSILEPNFRYLWNIPFTLDPKLLALLQEEGLAVTFGLLQECGLRVAPNNPKGTWDLEAKKPLSALYGSLSVLQQLAEA
ncbi:PREDICTED: LOW QUALITY PROTEIN: gasdermin-C [Capra hircus]|uniref:LOW QUALITY PROTEIN: gasdermin-C n=1 Tax=Capra hircus TaxID=9925 RepID=UPI0008467497|nr:PREDICTED: LOW QUALITY PROTEIN: gasdermin-C [Capra hircus]